MYRHVASIGLIAALLAIGGCKKDNESAAEPGEQATAAGVVAAVSGRTAAELLKGAADVIPATAGAVFVSDTRSIVLTALTQGAAGLLPPLEDPEAFMKDLGGVSKRFIGLDLTKIDHAVAYVSVLEKSAAVVIVGDWSDSTLKGKPVEVEGVEKAVVINGEVVLALVGKHLVIGNPDGVALVAGDGKKLAGSDQIKPLLAGLARVADGPIAVALAANLEKLAPLMKGKMPVEGIGEVQAVSMGSTLAGVIAASVTADEGTRKTIRGHADKALDMARGYFEMAASKIETTKRPEEAMLGVIAKHMGPAALSMLSIDDDGESLTFKLKGVGQSAAVIGVLSAVAVPAFLKYMKRAKTSEAIDSLDRLYKGASVFYSSPRVDPATGSKLPCAFPPTAESTPKGSPCGNPDEKFTPSARDWEAQTWQALNFEMRDPHYFKYSFKSSGTGAAAKFTVAAHADLDCDGTWSTFERYGHGDPDAGAGECTMKSSPAF